MDSSERMPTLYRPDEVAVRLKLSRTTIYDLIRLGEIRVCRFGRAVRIPADELARVIAERTDGGVGA